MKMLKRGNNIQEILYILENLRNEDRLELQALYNNDWKQEALLNISDKEFYILYGYDNDFKCVPIAIGDFYEIYPEDKSVACVWLLTTKYIYNNKSLFIRVLLNLLKQKSKKYKLFFNFIYQSNFEAKKWLKKLGFKFNNPHPKGLSVKENFEFFYKINERE